MYVTIIPNDIFIIFFLVVLPSAIVTVYDYKDKVRDMLESHSNQDTVTVFLAEVPKDTILSSDSECKMVDLEKVGRKKIADLGLCTPQ